jgi:hypothetical protein
MISMTDDDRIMTLHPQGKKGVNIRMEKYNEMKGAILENLVIGKETRLKALLEVVTNELGDRFDGSIPWYFTAVKQDLEARGLVKVEKKKGLQYVSK